MLISATVKTFTDETVPYQSSGGRRNNVQIGVGRSLWGGNPPPPIPERVLDGIPGLAAWFALLFSIICAIAFPRFLLWVATLLATYTALRFMFAGYANLRGMRLIKAWENVDWHARYQQEATPDSLAWDAVRHVVIVPNYKEEMATLCATLDNLARQYEARKRMVVVLAMESGESSAEVKAQQLIAQYRNCFAYMFYTLHPRGLPSEIGGKSSNEAWAGRWIKRRLIDEMGWDINTVVVTTMDADTLWHRDYFYALTCLFALDPHRHLRLWQAPIRYHANIWDINPLLRIINAYSGAFELAYLASPWWRPMPMSSYSLSLRALDGVGYWDTDVIAEDWHMYLKAYFYTSGQMQIVPIFLPFLATATTGDTFWEAVYNRYQQSLRHAWGSKEVGFVVAKAFEHPEIDIAPTLRLLVRVSHDVLLSGAGWIILTLGSQLPILLNPGLLPPFPQALADPLVLTLTLAGVLVVILGVVFWWVDVLSRPPRTRPQTLSERLLTVLSFPLLPLLSLIFLALPLLQAQTRLLIGSTLEYKVARKI